MLYDKCCVPGCNNTRKDAIMHKFPNSERRLKRWLDSINCGSLRAMETIDLCKLTVCHNHFENRFITVKSRLLGHAYPALFTAEEITSGRPSTSQVRSENYPTTDHSYARKRQNEHSYAASNLEQPPQKKSLHTMETLTDCPPLKTPEPAQFELSVTSTETPSIMKGQKGVASFQHDYQYSEPSASKSWESAQGEQNMTSIETPQEIKQKKVVATTTNLTPKCKRLYKEYRKSRKMLSFHRRAKRALKFSKENSFAELTENMNPISKQMLWMQIRLFTKNRKGRRFTLEEKLISLSIFKQGPRCYKFLQRIFILPSETTLKKFIARLNIAPGVNPQIFTSIKEEVSSWKDEKKKYCSIVFDEMALDTGLNYDKHKDIISGFVHLNERTNNFADHVLVFMIKGAVYKWQQAIAFYFCEGATKAPELKRILKEIIDAIGQTGLIPVALISDQGTSFQSALKSFQEETRREQILADEEMDDTIHIGEFTLNVIFDPPHLIKGLRNNFLTKDIDFDDGKKARWSDIVDAYMADCQHAESRLLPNINDEHVVPEKIKKMKVKNCVQIFSSTMAGVLGLCSTFSSSNDGKPVSETMKNTAEVVGFLDRLFDSVNGASLQSKKPKVTAKKKKVKELRSAVTSTSKHHQFWRDAIKKFEKFKFINKQGHKISVPSTKNWPTTLRSMQRLWSFFSKKGIKIMRPRYFNSDGVENFFGQVRAYNYRQNSPDCKTFTNTYKSLLITGFLKFHKISFNCEDEAFGNLLKMKSLFRSCNTPTLTSENEPENNTTEENESGERMNFNVNMFLEEARRERLSVQSRAYTAGWAVRKILAKVKCTDCKKCLCVDFPTEVHRWVSQREYKAATQKLTYASSDCVVLFGQIWKETNKYLEHSAHKEKVLKTIIKNVYEKYSFDFLSCGAHKTEVARALAEITVRLAIFNWCNVINKILRGTDVFRLENAENLPHMQAKALLKYKKKLKKVIK